MNIARTRNFKFLPIVVLCIVVIVAAPGWSTARVDNSIFAELLRKYVHNGQVNYDGLKKEESRLDQYLKVLENVDPDSLSRDEQFAFYANAYNAWTVKLILTGYPGIDSIKDLGSLFKSPWKKKLVRINGKVLTLDNVEHDILRPRFKDARVHFAINCAAYSCPPLYPEPFSAGKLDEQLTAATRSFINNPKRNYFEGGNLYVSKIFKWFAEDFDRDPYSFIVVYAEGNFKKELEAGKEKIKIKYLDYDWSLNNKPQ